ncbi:MAG: T9SS type A sorting domain-containing protein [Saprospiraceae bacterium]|nr:T9SS type A sorting domain-containing protein [Saprospiraceae bacterium]
MSQNNIFNLYFFFTICICPYFSFSQNNLPELPRINESDYCFPDTSGYKRITVGPIGRDYTDLQLALNAATPRTVLVLDAKAIFRGSFILRDKGKSNDWIVLISSQMQLLPVFGDRIKPGANTNNATYPLQSDAMPKLISINQSGLPTIRTEVNAHRYWLAGIDISIDPTVPQSFGLVNLGESGTSQNSIDKVPEWFSMDRCYIHGQDQANVMKYGVRLDCKNGAIIGCHISQFHSVGFDAQAISGVNGPGPFYITNNYLEGAGENILFGGGAPSIAGLVPSDILITKNYFHKPNSWKIGHPTYAGKHWTIKNLFELKTGKRVLLEGNILENCWADLPIGQSGYAILLTIRTENGGSPQADVSDVTIRSNIIRHTGAGISVSGSDDGNGIKSKRILIENNLMYEINGPLYGDNNINGPNVGTAFHLGEPIDLTIRHNTILHTGAITWAYKTMTGFSFTDNLCHSYISAGGYQGIYGPGVNQGNATFTRYFPDLTDVSLRFHKNVLIGGNASRYTNFNTSSTNYFPQSTVNVGFLDYVNGFTDYRNFNLTLNSPYYKAGSDMENIGANFVTLEKAITPVPICNIVNNTHEKINLQNAIQVYPTIFNEEINIQNGNHDFIESVQIFNIESKLFHHQKSIISPCIIKTNEWPDGLYFIKIETASGIETYKLIKTNY